MLYALLLAEVKENDFVLSQTLDLSSMQAQTLFFFFLTIRVMGKMFDSKELISTVDLLKPLIISRYDF